MAATLSSDQEELTFFSFPIEKREDTATINPVDGTPDILIWGKATDGTIDGDREIVDPQWSAKAIQQWADTGANIRMSHDPKRPVGKGQQVQITAEGHYVKGLIADPLAKHFIRTGVLNDYSVGIMNPDFKYRDPGLDPHGKALRIITGRPDGSSRIGEISICDRGSNFNSSFRIVKSADGFTGQMVGDEDEIAKAAPASLTKAAHDGIIETLDGATVEKSQSADMSTFAFPEDLSVTFTPNDMARLMQTKIVEKHYAGLAVQAADTEKRDVATAERRSLASEGNALPDGSYPIKNTGDLHNAAVLARSGHGDVAAARRLIARRAGELGVQNPLEESDDVKKGTGGGGGGGEYASGLVVTEGPVQSFTAPEAVKEAEPEVTKDPEEAKDKPVKKAKKKKKLPPWLNKPGDDAKGDDDSCKQDHAHTEKCKTTPAEAAGLSGTHDMTCAPVPEMLESPPMASTKAGTPMSTSGAQGQHMTPVPQHREPDGAIVEPFEKDAGMPATGQGETPTALEAGMMKSSPEVAAMLRFKHAGISTEFGRLHDLTCPAYHPEDVAKCHPFADLRLIDEAAFQREAVKAACGPDMERAKSLNLAWQASRVLREADPAELNDYRLAAHKAFRDANPGPSSAPTPGMISPGKYNRPLITDGHEASSTGHDGPNSSPQVATTAPNAHGFDRPPLSAGHQSPSPSFMKASFEYPSEQGQPMQLNYAVMEKERARHALMAMHEHLSRQFPEACPMDLTAAAVQPESRGVPPTAGIGKSEKPSAELLTEQVHNGVISIDEARKALGLEPFGLPETSAPVAAVFKAPAEEEGQFADAEVYKSFKKMRKKLGKKVLSGKMTVDEARSRMGRQFAQKGGEAAPYTGPVEPLQEALEKVAAEHPGTVTVLPPAQKSAALTPDLIKAAVREAMHAESVPLEPATIASFDPSPAIEAAVTKAVTPLLEKIQAQDTKLAETQRVIDAIADQPDPSTASFSGLAFNPVRKAARPAGVVEQSEIAERTQQMMIRHLQDKYNASSDPAEREAYYDTLAKMRGFGQ